MGAGLEWAANTNFNDDNDDGMTVDAEEAADRDDSAPAKTGDNDGN